MYPMLYAELAELYDTLEKTSKRLEMTWHLAQAIGRTEEKDLGALLLLLQGRVLPPWDERKVGVAEKLVGKAISRATGASAKEVESLWAKRGDLGLVAEELSSKKRQSTLRSERLEVRGVLERVQGLTSLEGEGSVDRKVEEVSRLLSASPREARYLVRTVLEQLRIGVGAGTLRDAIAWALLPKVLGVLVPCSCGALNPALKTCMQCGKPLPKKLAEIQAKGMSSQDFRRALESGKSIPGSALITPESDEDGRALYTLITDAVQHAYDMLNDFGAVARIAKRKGLRGLRESSIEVFTPVKMMLAQKEDTLAAAMSRVGVPCAAEYKLDGFRVQAHLQGGGVRLFTRRLEDVTAQFPEILPALRGLRVNDAVLDGEAVGFDPASGKCRPFQEVSQRIRRKYGIEEMARELPVRLYLFDVLMLEGETLLKTPFRKRREALGRMLPKEGKYLALAPQLVTASEKEVEDFFAEALAEGHEGLMLKNLDAPYQPGARVGHMVKYKVVMDALDLVIVGAEHGEGKRAGWLTSYTLACRGNAGELLEIGKVSTGLKEKEEEGLSFMEMTRRLKPLASGAGKSMTVKPAIVIEVHYEEIQSSSNYSSGYALRFPRVIRLRDDKGPEDASTLQQVEQLYAKQRGRG